MSDDYPHMKDDKESPLMQHPPHQMHPNPNVPPMNPVYAPTPFGQYPPHAMPPPPPQGYAPPPYSNYPPNYGQPPHMMIPQSVPGMYLPNQMHGIQDRPPVIIIQNTSNNNNNQNVQVEKKIVVVEKKVYNPSNLPTYSVECRCQSCNYFDFTEVSYEIAPGCVCCMIVFLIISLALWPLLLCWLYIIPSLNDYKNYNHYCRKCRNRIGISPYK